MPIRVCTILVIWTLSGVLAQAETLSVKSGRQTIVIRAGQYNTTHFPDQPISILSERPLTALMVCVNGTKLFYGRSWDSITFADYVLRPGGESDFDGGYAGIGGIHRDGQTIFGLYHAENHAGKSSEVSKARNQLPGNFSVGLAVSRDGGKTFQKLGQVLSSSHPYKPGQECGGLGDITMCANKDNTHLLAYYADFSRGQDKGIQIATARCAIKDVAIPNKWEKYHNGKYGEPGLGGKETYVLSLNSVGADAWCPHVTYSKELDRYLLTFAATYNSETDGTTYYRPVKSGIYIASSTDGLQWSEPVAAFNHSVLLIKGVPGALHPTLILNGKTNEGVRGTLYYAYTPDWAKTPHHLASRPVTITLTADAAPRDLKTALAGTKWVNSNNVTFEWTKDGRLLHSGKEREWKVLDQSRVQIVLGPGHEDTIVFNDDLKTFKQRVKGGPTSFTGRLESASTTATAPSQSKTSSPVSLDAFLKDAKSFKKNSQGEVVELDLSNVKLGDAEIATLGGLVHLQRLTAPQSGLSDDHVTRLTGLSKLTSLGLWQTRISNEGLKTIGKLQKLSYLSVEGNRGVTGEGLAHLVACRNLSWLGLSHTGISDDGMKHLTGLPLTRLDITNTGISDVGLNHIAKIRTLKTLNLTKTRVTDTGVTMLKMSLPNCKVTR